MRQAFTVIELLVVLTVVAVVAAVLYPVLALSRASQQQTQCIANQKQIAQAILLYAQSHANTLPASKDVWSVISVPNTAKHCPAADKSLANAYVYSNAVAGQTIADFYEPRVEILTGDGQHQASTATATEAATLSNIAYRKSDFALRHENTLVVSYLDGHVDAITKTPDILPVRAGLQLWLNPESLANQGLQDGDRVKTWQDSSKDNNYCTINIPNWYPVMTANSLNGFPSIRVASSKNQQLFSQGSPKLDTNTLSWWCVGRTDSAPADRCQILLRTRYKVGCTLKDASDAMWGCFVQNGNFTVHARNGNCNNIQNVFSYAGYEGKFVSLNGIWNATTFTGYFNGKPGTPVDNIQCSPSGNIGVTLAGWGHTDGNIAEVIVYNRALNDQERHAVERYLNDKYQLY